jgi:hypothetical protein
VNRIAMVLFKPPGNLPAYSSGFSPAYADRVARNIYRHAGSRTEVVVLTDYPADDFTEGQTLLPFQHPERGWCSLMELFRPDVVRGGALLIGLDTVFVGGLDRVWNAIREHGYIACGGRTNLPDAFSNSVVGIDAKHAAAVWEDWCHRRTADLPNKRYWLYGAFSEMFWLRDRHPSNAYWQKVLPGRVVSYKQHLDRMRPGDDVAICYFHGEPKPHNLADEWIKREWA